jgi:hypothetical protein
MVNLSPRIISHQRQYLTPQFFLATSFSAITTDGIGFRLDAEGKSEISIKTAKIVLLF